MDHHNLEPDVRGAGLILIAVLCVLGLFTGAFGAWAVYKEGQPVIVEVVSEEGQAKSIMIEELTGITFPPEVAKWAVVSFSGTTVSIETQSINIWDGKKWK